MVESGEFFEFSEIFIGKIRRRTRADAGKFKTPSLVSVSRSAPYMHGGLFPHLIGVINMYNAGFPVAVEKGVENDPLLPKTDPLIKKLNLTRDEILALEAFLKSL